MSFCYLCHVTEGLRQRKKQRTREQIVNAAMGLFDERGYQATTIADIAEAADVAPRTFFSYFPSKEAVVFHTLDRDLESLETMLRERPAGEQAFDALRRWIEAMFDQWKAEGEESSLRKRLCRENETLANFATATMGRIHTLLLDAVARDLGEPADALRPRLVAAAAVAALSALDAELSDDEAEHTVPDKAEALAVLDDALVFLRAGSAALQEREPVASR